MIWGLGDIEIKQIGSKVIRSSEFGGYRISNCEFGI